MAKGLLIIISGPSGVGKGTIRQAVMKDPSLNLWYSVSLTTREQRPGEVDGREYFFVSEKEFADNLKRGNLLEHACFVGHHYGTPLDKAEEKRLEGRNVILEIEVNGTLQVLDRLKDQDVVSIFLMPPSFQDLEARIRGRCTEGEKCIEERLKKAKKEMGMSAHYKYVVTNDSVERAASEIQGIIRKEIELARSSMTK
ncbi:MAG: guanylate kinase [Bacilli bacterium]|jgi:guanylate kinase|nr:guanylate kinase [Bacilli bacterium]